MLPCIHKTHVGQLLRSPQAQTAIYVDSSTDTVTFSVHSSTAELPNQLGGLSEWLGDLLTSCFAHLQQGESDGACLCLTCVRTALQDTKPPNKLPLL